MAQAEIDSGRAHDEAEKRAYYTRPRQSWLAELWNRIVRMLQ